METMLEGMSDDDVLMTELLLKNKMFDGFKELLDEEDDVEWI